MSYLGWFLIGFGVAYCWMTYDNERLENSLQQLKDQRERLLVKTCEILRGCMQALNNPVFKERDEFKKKILKFINEN